jgi:hypothetical protein
MVRFAGRFGHHDSDVFARRSHVRSRCNHFARLGRQARFSRRKEHRANLLHMPVQIHAGPGQCHDLDIIGGRFMARSAGGGTGQHAACKRHGRQE